MSELSTGTSALLVMDVQQGPGHNDPSVRRAGDPEVHRVLTEKVFPRQADTMTASEWTARVARASGGGTS
jgi:hypothetical protein